MEDLPRSGRPSTFSTEVNIAEVGNGQAVNKEYYLSVMKHLREQSRRKRADLCKENSWILHHDNAPSHVIEDIKENLQPELKSIPENAFKKCFHDWIIR